MSLKRKITKAEHAALIPALQVEYKAEGEEFVLDAEGFEDPAELRRAKDREVEARKAAEKKAADAAEELRLSKESTARTSGDIVTLEKSWKDKLAANDASHKAEIAKLDKHLQSTLVDSVASQLAAEIAGENAAILLPHIQRRLTADLSSDTPLTRVLDADGKPSASSVEDLRKEFVANPRFKAVVIVSKASGGGAAGNGSKNGNGGAGAGAENKKFKDLNDAERVALYKADPAAFEVASTAHKQEVKQVYESAVQAARSF